MLRFVLLIALLMSGLACSSGRTLNANTLPAPGWTAAQVETALGPSIQKSVGMNPPVEIWRYGVGTSTGMGFGPVQVLPQCNRYSSSCLSVILREGQVVDVRVSPY